MEKKQHIVNKKASQFPIINMELVADMETPRILACNDIISFIVGGTHFQILKSKFAHWPTTRLSRLIRAKTKHEILSLCSNYVVCEKSGQIKTYIFLRNGNNFNAILDKCCFCIEPVGPQYY